MTGSFCTFDGTAVMVRVEGRGRAVLVEPAPFKDGHLSRVFLPGATIAPGLPNPRLEHPAALHPLGLNPVGKDYVVEYRAGDSTTITVKQGGADGGYVGPLPDGTVCPPSWCPVVWSGASKEIEFARDTKDGFAVTTWFPYGVEPGKTPLSRVSSIQLEMASGVLRCDERSERLEGDLIWNAGSLSALTLRGPDTDGPRKGLWIQDGRLHIHVENDAPPQINGSGHLVPKLWGLTGVTVLVIAFLFIRWTRRPSTTAGAATEEVDASMLPPARVFVSSAPSDAEALKKLLNHLSSLRAEGAIMVFSQADMQGGDDAAKLDEELERAELVLLLVSAEYIANDSVQKQLATSMAKHSQGRARVIPILVRPVDYSGATFSMLEPLPRSHSEHETQAVSSHVDQDRVWAGIARDIRSVVTEIRSKALKASTARDRS